MQMTQSDIDHLNWLQHSAIDSFKGLRILDLGCGSGYLCHKAMLDGAKSAIGVDLLTPAFFANGGNGWQFLSTNLNQVDWHKTFDQPFDLILAFDIVEHLDSPYQFLSSCKQALSPQGRLILTTPNVVSWERYARPTNWSGVQDPQHKTLFTRYSLNFLLKKAGFKSSKQQAPMRALSFLGPLQPHIGGQILSISDV